MTSCYDSHSRHNSSFIPIPPKTHSIKELYDLIGDAPIDISSDIIISGRVTTSDEAGNFYRTLFIEDDSGGCEIMVGLYNTSAIYPEGSFLAVSLVGCRVYRNHGVLQIGLPFFNPALGILDYFNSQIMLDRHIIIGADIIPLLPFSLNEPSTDYCGRLVEVSSLTLKAAEDSENTLGEETIFLTRNMTEICVHVSKWADFATEPIPNGELSITGIISLEKKDRLVLTPRSYDDIKPILQD